MTNYALPVEQRLQLDLIKGSSFWRIPAMAVHDLEAHAGLWVALTYRRTRSEPLWSFGVDDIQPTTAEVLTIVPSGVDDDFLAVLAKEWPDTNGVAWMPQPELGTAALVAVW